MSGSSDAQNGSLPVSLFSRGQGLALLVPEMLSARNGGVERGGTKKGEEGSVA